MSPIEQIMNLLDELEMYDRVWLIDILFQQLREDLEAQMDAPKTPVKRPPRLPEIFKAGFINTGEELVFRNDNGKLHRDKAATLVDGHKVNYKGSIVRINAWAKSVPEWEAITIYQYVYSVSQKKTLGEIRDAYLASRRDTDS